MKKLFYMIAMLCMLALWPTVCVHAEDTGKLITNKCRANLKMLNDGTARFLAENDAGLPFWGNYDTILASLIDSKYFASKPEAPTRDCKYNLVSVSRDDYQWYCDIHGVLEGEKTVTFRYHEHRLMGKTTSRYANIQKYRDHVKDLLRWTEYAPTPVEKLKYHYNMNPLTTIILGIVGVIVMFLIYRNVT